MSSVSSQTDTDTVKERFLLALSNGRKIAVLKSEVETVLRISDVTFLPGCPSGVLGLMNLYGEPLPVISVCKRIFDEDETELDASVMLLSSHKKPAGFMVNQVTAVSFGQYDENAVINETSETAIPDAFLKGLAHFEDEESVAVLSLTELAQFEITPKVTTTKRRPLMSWGNFFEMDEPPDLHLLISSRADKWFAIAPKQIEQISRLPLSKNKGENSNGIQWVRHGLLNLPLIDPANYMNEDVNGEDEEQEKTPLVIILKSENERLAIKLDQVVGFEVLNIKNFNDNEGEVPAFVASVSKWNNEDLWLLNYAKLNSTLG